jgi:hypothetical protein
MGKTSAKQRMTQLMEWIPTMKFGRKKPAKSNVDDSGTTQRPRMDYNVKIKNM